MTAQPHDPHCRELFEKISDYLDRDLSREEREEMETHIRNCAMCTTCLETLKRTVEFCGSLPFEEVPAMLSARLREIAPKKQEG